MTPASWAVLVAGLAAIAWVNWYFFLAERGAAVADRDPSTRARAS